MTDVGRRGRRGGEILLAFTLLARPALADPSPDDTVAEALFQQGKQRMARGEIDAACPMLAESQRLDPGGGTVLALALCLERQGRFASAWASFRDALSFAVRDHNNERQQVAQDHIAGLFPRLSHVTIEVNSRDFTSTLLVISLDGRPVPASAWGQPQLVDPGLHHVVISASGYTAREIDVQADEARVVTVPVAPLTPLTPPPTRPALGSSKDDSSAPAHARPGWSARRWSAITLGVLATGSLVAGSVLGGKTLSTMSSVRQRCPMNPCTDADAAHLRDDARHTGNLSTLTVSLGAVGLGAATLLWLSEPISHTTIGLAPGAAPGAGRLELRGSW